MTQNPEPPMGGGYPPPPAGGSSGQPHPQGTTILVLGILGLVVCGPLGIVAFVMGRKALPEAEASGAPNVGLIKAGYICGIIATVLMVLGILLLLILLATGAFSASTDVDTTYLIH